MKARPALFAFLAAVTSAAFSAELLAADAVIHVGAQQQVGNPIALDGTHSSGINPEGKANDKFGITRYAWDFGDGTGIHVGQYLASTVHTYSEPGTYTVKLTVTDYKGETDSTTETITVGALPKLTVSGKTSSAIQGAIDSLSGPGIVVLPAGTYSLSSAVVVPSNVTLMGQGTTKTILKNTSSSGGTWIIRTGGNNVRVADLSLVGPGDTHYGISTTHKNLFIDNLNIYHFAKATRVYGTSAAPGSMTVENSNIHHNPSALTGYGVLVEGVAYAVIRNNTFSNNRHDVSSGGVSVYSQGYDFIGNHIRYDDVAPSGQSLDTHEDTLGRIRVADNLVEDVSYFVSMRNGWAEIRNNTLRNVTGYLLRTAGPDVHNVTFERNEMTNTTARMWLQYGRGMAVNCRAIDNLIPDSDLQVSWDDCSIANPNPPILLQVD